MIAAKKILLVQLYSNGDCLYATAVARQIKNDFPGCILTWGVSPSCRNILSGNPYIDETLVIDDVLKDDTGSFRRLKVKLAGMKQDGTYDELFITHIADTNLALYDGCIRSNVLRAYPFPITVPLTPVLRLSDAEISQAKTFATAHQLEKYKHVLLFEFAPQSGQSKITKEFALEIAERIAERGDAAVILSSGNKMDHPHPAVIDGSSLSLRETAALTHSCSLLLGCSSGITWISTSDAAKQLPMIQLLNAQTKWVNPISRDFKRFGFEVDQVIELVEFDLEKTMDCINAALLDFPSSRRQYNQQVPLHFKTTHNIVYNLLCYAEFSAISKHIRANREIYGNNLSFYGAVAWGFISFPFKLLRNIFKKKIAKR